MTKSLYKLKMICKFILDLSIQPLRELRWVGLRESAEPYEFSFPRASYAPWLGDKDFLFTLEAVRTNTMVDVYRCWELWTLAGETAKLDGNIIEVGAWRSGTGALLAKKTQLAGRSSDQIFICDTFEGVVKASAKDNRYVGGEHSDTSQNIVENLYLSLGLIIRAF